ncbi:leucyl aminopeptidase [mine drainage metagenome]|uniref:leucyl aminopeptidase n=2 Tax=mine drainage metagenome TaxID=410659 RepID=T0ZR55_9ZZZZ
MKLEAVRAEAWDLEDVEAVVVGLTERSGPEPALPRSLGPDDEKVGGYLKRAVARGEIRGKRGELHVVPLPGLDRRLIVAGLGPDRSLDAEELRRVAGSVVRQARGRRLRSLAFRLPLFTQGRVDPADAASAMAEGCRLALYEFTRFKPTETPGTVERVVLALGPEQGRLLARVRGNLETAEKLSEAVVWARDIGNLPANVASPAFLAEQARAMGKEFGLKVTVYDEQQLAEMGCGGLLAVGGGSSTHPPRMVVVEYPGQGGARSRTVGVVGKGITFDSGGISIKPAIHMSDMKFDKSGAVAVLGILRAAAALKVRPRVIGVLCCAENVPSGSSYRPGDVVRTFGGKTIEVLNTDAEGRVVLSDGLSWVNATHHPDFIIDLATLTGACVTALGFDSAGLFATDDGLARALLASGEATGERLWRMPLRPVHHEMVRSDVADVKNSLEAPPAGAITAAAFLHTFVGDTPWAHLDIAGTAYVGSGAARFAPSYASSGFVGFGIRLLADYLKGL